MKKAIKVLLFFLGGIAGVLIILTVVIRVLFPPARLRELVQDEIRRQIHREAQIGPVHLSLWGITLERLRLSDVPNFSTGTFLYVEEAHVRWAWAPLLQHVVVVRDVVLESPQISLVRHPDGKTLNISDLQQTAPQKRAVRVEIPTRAAGAAPPSASASSWSWKIDRIQLKDGAINFNDLSPAGQTTTLSKIDLDLDNLTATQARGQLNVAHLQNTVYVAQDFHLEWKLQDIDPPMAHLKGWIHLRQGPGTIQNLSRLAGSSKGANLVFMPIVMLQNLDRLGFVNLGLPDFSHWPIKGIVGDYLFENGTMKIQKFSIASQQLSVDALGFIELATGKLAVDVSMQAPQRTLMGELGLKLHISGTLADPKTNLDSLKKKAFKATLKNVLENPDAAKDINKALKSIFH